MPELDARAGQTTPQPAPSDHSKVEALIETSKGDIIIEFFPKEAPRHVEYFIARAREGAYDGTAFHRMYKYGLIQGGDPTTRNTTPRGRALYGTGGLNANVPDEVNKHKHITGAVSAALAQDRANPNETRPNSSGAQFFIVLAPQPQLDAKFTVFGRVVSGMDVAAEISTTPTNPQNLANDRIEIKRITVREKTPGAAQMKNMAALIETSLGNIKIELLAEAAPETVRAFYHYAKSGLYDGTTFFRVSQKYFLEAGALSEWPADSPNRKRFFSLWPAEFEKNDIKHLRGAVSMRQVEGGSTRWYFFIISQDNPGLDGRHVPFARVVEGLDVIDKISQIEVEGDKPKQRIEIKRIVVQ
jgi:peptidyl-prolyl cis-trans isomerase B (cyclophilin B)